MVRALSLGAVFVAVLLVPGVPAAYVSIGADPAGDDQGDVVIADVVRTKRAVWRNDDGHRWFRVAVRTRLPLRATNADLMVRVDARGDRHADVVMHIRMFEGKACWVGERSGRVRISGHHASCVVPLRWIGPGGKRIRWRIVSQPREGGPAYHTDRAPDSGWYR